MAIKVEDIIPFSSGTSHLGVNEGVTAGSFDASSTIPFGHIIQLSGVFVDPVQGQSGILRFNQEQGAFETSVDGGATFSAIGAGGGGNITSINAEVGPAIIIDGANGVDVNTGTNTITIDGAALSGLTVQDLQNAYNNGNCIDADTVQITDGQTESYRGILVKLDKPGLESLSLTNFNNAVHDSFGVAVSGHSLTPDDHLTHAFTNIGAGNIFLQSSGIDASIPPANLLLGFLPSVVSPGNTVGVMSVGGGIGGVTDFFFTGSNDARFLAEEGRILLQNFGLSGQFTYKFGTHEGWAVKTGQTGLVSGPESDGFFPLPHSGQICQMILEKVEENSIQTINGEDGPAITVDGVNGIDIITGTDTITIDAAAVSGLTPTVTLQDAYDGGDEIDLDVVQGEYRGVVLRENTGVVNLSVDKDTEGYSIMASGYSDTPEESTLAYNTRVGSNGIVVQSSGSTDIHPNSLLVGFDGSTDIGSVIEEALISARGPLTIESASGISVSAEHWGVVTDTFSNVISFGNVGITAGIGTDESLGQTQLLPWGGSGRLTYEFGPNEAWHTSPSHTSDKFPLPHSGQVNQMILEALPPTPSLQETYEVNPDVALNDGDLRIIASDDKLVLGTFGNKAEVNMSGVVGGPFDTDHELGDLTMMAHGLADRDPGATSLDDVAALSLGIPSIAVGTNGSGIAPIVPASGITRYKNSALQTFTAAVATNIIFDLEYFDNDQFYAYDSSVTGIRVFVPGLYRVDANVLLFSNQTSSVTSLLTRNGVNLNGFSAAQLVFQNTFTSMHNYGLLNLNAGDYISISAAGTGGGSLTVFSAGDASINLEYKGPPRGQAGG